MFQRRRALTQVLTFVIMTIVFANMAVGTYSANASSDIASSDITHSTTPLPPMLSPGTTMSQHFTYQGYTRNYLIHMSKIYDPQKPCPLILFFHGSLENPNQYVDLGFNNKVDESGGIAIYPAGINNDWRVDQNVNDNYFALEIIYRLKQQYTIDPNRIYCAGHSAGGFMAYALGAGWPDVFAAIAPNAASMGFITNNASAPWSITEPKGPISVIVSHGTRDSSIPYNGEPRSDGFILLSVAKSVAIWVNTDGCNETPKNTTSPDGRTIKTLYTGGMDGTEVVLYTLVGLYHAWPNPFNSGVNAVDITWEFFMSHPKIAEHALRITVKDSYGVAISGASILSLSQPSVQSALTGVSGGDGAVVFTGVSPGNYTMQAQKSGYVSSTGKVSVTREGMYDVMIIMEATGSLKVAVKDSSGSAISGVNISSTTQPSGQLALSGTSSVNGTATFSNLLPGSYTVQASKPGYNSASGTASIAAGSIAEVTIAIQKIPTTGGLRVTVKDSTGVAVSGASVSSTTQPSGQAGLSGATGVDGAVVFNDVLPGSYTLQASKGGYVSATGTASVTAGATVDVGMTLQVQQSSGGGIPGFPFASVVVGLFLCTAWYWVYTRRTRL